jgi:hypothetical protein
VQCCVRQFISPGGKKHQIWELFVGIKIRWWQLTKLRHIIMRWNKLCRKFLKVRLNHNPIDTPLILPKKEWTNERMNEQTNEQKTNKRMNERTNERMNLGFFFASLLFKGKNTNSFLCFLGESTAHNLTQLNYLTFSTRFCMKFGMLLQNCFHPIVHINIIGARVLKKANSQEQIVLWYLKSHYLIDSQFFNM